MSRACCGEPSCNWCRSLWSFWASLLCRGSTGHCPGNAYPRISWAAFGSEGAALGQAVCRVCTWTCCQLSSRTPPRTLRLQRGFPCDESGLCPHRGWCTAQCSRFPVRVNSRACHCANCKNMMDLIEKKCLLCGFWFFFFFLLLIWLGETVTACVQKVSSETWSKWEGGITKSILFLLFNPPIYKPNPSSMLSLFFAARGRLRLQKTYR